VGNVTGEGFAAALVGIAAGATAPEAGECYLGGLGANDRLGIAKIEGAVVEGDGAMARGPHVGDFGDSGDEGALLLGDYVLSS
jgi:hypothetical protein